MNDFLTSLKSDLLDRRMLPLLALLGLGLIGALAYAVLGGGSSSTPKPVASVTHAAPSPVEPSLPVSQAPVGEHAAVSETTEGTRFQHHGGTHNPFTPLASAKSPGESGAAGGSSTSGGSGSQTSGSTGAGSSGGSGSSGSSGGAGTGGAGTTPEQPTQPAPTKPQKPKTIYVVDVLYGVAPTTAGQLSQLTPYANLKRLEPLPSASDPRIVYAGVNAAGTAALFTLAGEAILNGQGSCVPRATQCEALALGQGQTEEFGYLEENGQSVVYDLKVVSIAKRKASAARAASLNRGDHAGQALMRRLAPAFLRHLRFSSALGVLVYAAHPRHHH